MRIYLFFAIACVLLILGQMATANVRPCEAEESAHDAVNSDLAFSLTQLVELQSKLTTEKDGRNGPLADQLKTENDLLSQANESGLKETRIYNLLITARPQLSLLIADQARLADWDKQIVAHMTAEPKLPFSAALARVQQDVGHSGLSVFLNIVRNLESLRSWSDEMTALRELMANEGTIVPLAIQKALQLSESLQESLINHSQRLAEIKIKVDEAQSRIDSSLQAERRNESRLIELKRRIDSLRARLPVVKAKLHACMRRAQFGK